MTIRLAVLPDTQVMADRRPDLFDGIGDWLARHADRLDAVLHVGDVVDRGAADAAQLAVAARVRDRIVAAGLPLFVAAGNHDDDVLLAGEQRSLTAFARDLTVDPTSPWIAGGRSDDDTDATNRYGFVTAGDERLLVVVAEFGPRPEVAAWVDRVLQQHADTDAVLVTHGWLNCDGTRMRPGVPFHPDSYAATRGGLDAEAWWPKLRRHDNLRMILCGHQVPGPLAYRVDAGEAGHGVLASYQNWQMDPDGGGGRIRLAEWDPATRTVTLTVVNTASGEVEQGPGHHVCVDLTPGSADIGTIHPGIA